MVQFIIDKHREEVKYGRLLPFISQQKYNEAIKEIFEVAGITHLNPTTGIEEQVPINTIATSHIVRRCNLYKKVKDQNLVGALSGHSVGSKAFARYRGDDIHETGARHRSTAEYNRDLHRENARLETLISEAVS